MLIGVLARYEDEMRQEGRILPICGSSERPLLKETDAERQIAFCQEQRRAGVMVAVDNKRVVKDNAKGPLRRLVSSEDRVKVAISVKRSISEVRRN